MWLNVCDLDKLNNSTLTDKDKELELKGASRSPIENDRMISTLSELIIFKMARWRFRVICHWLWAGDFSFLLPSWCRDWETPPLVIYEIQLLPVTAPSTAPQFSAVQGFSQLTSGHNQRCIRKILSKLGWSYDSLLSTENIIIFLWCESNLRIHLDIKGNPLTGNFGATCIL